MKVKEDVLGSPFVIGRTVSVEKKNYQYSVQTVVCLDFNSVSIHVTLHHWRPGHGKERSADQNLD